MTEIHRHPPIDVGAVVRRSYRHVAEDFHRLMIYSVGAALALGIAELTLSGLATLLVPDDRKPADFASGWGLILSIAAFGVGVLRYLLMVAVAVHWHREILLREGSWLKLQIGGREARYFVWLLAWFVVFGVVMILIYSTLRYLGVDFSLTAWFGGDGQSMDDQTQVWRVVIAAVAYTVLIAPFYVVALVLPAQAVDEKKFGFLSALRLTRGNFWRIALASLFFKPPIFALILLAIGLVYGLDGRGGWVAGFFLSVAADTATFVWICLEAGFLSFVYQALRAGAAAPGR